MAEHWGPKSFLVLCACGFSFRTASAAAADNTAARHRENGVESCDHAMFVGYDPPSRGQQAAVESGSWSVRRRAGRRVERRFR